MECFIFNPAYLAQSLVSSILVQFFSFFYWLPLVGNDSGIFRQDYYTESYAVSLVTINRQTVYGIIRQDLGIIRGLPIPGSVTIWAVHLPKGTEMGKA